MTRYILEQRHKAPLEETQLNETDSNGGEDGKGETSLQAFILSALVGRSIPVLLPHRPDLRDGKGKVGNHQLCRRSLLSQSPRCRCNRCFRTARVL